MKIIIYVIVVISLLGCITDKKAEPVDLNKNNVLVDHYINLSLSESEVIYFEINHPIEFDGLSKNGIYEHRRLEVEKYGNIVSNSYEASDKVFGKIIDGVNWWGIEGQFCEGPGENSNKGASEESRFISNPFLLLALDEDTALIVRNDDCTPVYPRLLELLAYPKENRIVAKYDISRFLREKDEGGLASTGYFFIENLNARDFGYNFVVSLENESTNIRAENKGGLFEKPVKLKSYIHKGGSCKKKGGCNNRSPGQNLLYITVGELPAEINLRLYKRYPYMFQKPDLKYTIKMI